MAKLTDLSVSFLSLVKTPATGKGLTLKSKDGKEAIPFELKIKNDDLMRAYGIVYAPDQEDAHGDSADAATIRRAATEFMREARLKNIDTEHSFTTEMAFVAESWLTRSGDALFPDEPEGSWAVGIQIGDPDLWKQLKSGDLTGISLAGIARMEPEPDDPSHPRYTEKDAAMPGWFKSFIKAVTGSNPNQEDPIEETEMDKKEVQDIVRDTLKSELGPAIKDALKSAGDPPADPPREPAQSEVQKEIAAALKAAGIEPKAPEGDGDKSDVEKRLDALDDKLTKALAKGATETDPSTGNVEESFA